MLVDSIENKKLVLEEFLKLCPLEGWSDETLKKACINCKIDEGYSNLIFENGALDVADFFSRSIDEETQNQIKALDLENMRIRDKIKEAVKIRLKLNSNYKSAIKRLIAFYYNPAHIPNAVKNSYHTSDLIWRAIGDKSTDFNFYTKRTVLSKVYIKTLKFFIEDTSPDNSKSWECLDNEIEKVMKIEKIKREMRNFVEKLGNIKQNRPSDCLKTMVCKLPFIRLFNK